MNYNSKRWDHMREAILRRDQYTCQECKRYGRMRSGSHVHHIFPAEIYPEYEWQPWNLTTLCQACHNAMHDRETHELSTKGEQLRCRTLRNINQVFHQSQDGTMS